MSKETRRYTIALKQNDGSEDIVILETSDIDWSMDQWSRNREHMTWKVLDVEPPIAASADPAQLELDFGDDGI